MCGRAPFQPRAREKWWNSHTKSVQCRQDNWCQFSGGAYCFGRLMNLSTSRLVWVFIMRPTEMFGLQINLFSMQLKLDWTHWSPVNYCRPVGVNKAITICTIACWWGNVTETKIACALARKFRRSTSGIDRIISWRLPALSISLVIGL